MLQQNHILAKISRGNRPADKNSNPGLHNNKKLSLTSGKNIPWN
jgi:hypothetical protein